MLHSCNQFVLYEGSLNVSVNLPQLCGEGHCNTGGIYTSGDGWCLSFGLAGVRTASHGTISLGGPVGKWQDSEFSASSC